MRWGGLRLVSLELGTTHGNTGWLLRRGEANIGQSSVCHVCDIFLWDWRVCGSFGGPERGHCGGKFAKGACSVSRAAEKEHGDIFGNRERLLEGCSACRERLLLFCSDVGVALHLVDALELAYDKSSAIRSEIRSRASVSSFLL